MLGLKLTGDNDTFFPHSRSWSDPPTRLKPVDFGLREGPSFLNNSVIGENDFECVNVQIVTLSSVLGQGMYPERE